MFSNGEERSQSNLLTMVTVGTLLDFIYRRIQSNCQSDCRREREEPVYDYTRISKCQFIDAGVSGIVELTSSNTVIESPWAGRNAKLYRSDLDLEVRPFRTLGNHPRSIKFLGTDDKFGSMFLEYMENGTLRKYLKD